MPQAPRGFLRWIFVIPGVVSAISNSGDGHLGAGRDVQGTQTRELLAIDDGRQELVAQRPDPQLRASDFAQVGAADRASAHQVRERCDDLEGRDSARLEM